MLNFPTGHSQVTVIFVKQDVFLDLNLSVVPKHQSGQLSHFSLTVNFFAITNYKVPIKSDGNNLLKLKPKSASSIYLIGMSFVIQLAKITNYMICSSLISHTGRKGLSK